MPNHRKYPVPKVGDKYNDWTTISVPIKGWGRFKCSCGEECLVREYDVTSGNSKRCRKCGDRQPKPTMRRTHLPHVPNELYNRLRLRAFNAINRCTNQDHPRYHDWGGRGIKVEFATIEEFVEHLLTLPGHDDPSLFLDRENNNGNYKVGNLRFVTPSESKYNQRSKGGV